ncbi:vanadium-dependent haloperoxidase [Cecembia sp.]|uniref:vanadium-dependent haloperoxidase n=1 Tax=Cecembia sp. TaxID=1898110 RepID=UPI0025B86F25|nr:vanadium-dependent haloperoxidase [Cecembia sp.]
MLSVKQTYPSGPSLRTSILSVLFSFFTISFSGNIIAQQKSLDIDIYVDNLFHITEVMVTDVASLPAAARFYAYTTLAAQIAWSEITNSSYHRQLLSKSLIGNLDLDNPPSGLRPEFVSIYSMLEVGKKIMPSGKTLEQKQQDFIKTALKKRWISKKSLKLHLDYAKYIATEVMNLASTDGYNSLSTLTRYSPKKGDGYWYPTPPAYMAAVEPEWRTIRPFFIEDIQDFKPSPPAAFSLEEGSSFHNQLMEVYEVTSGLTEEEKLIANFWDCNPFMVQYSGHMAIGIKKISPGGHWVGITGIAAQKAGLDWQDTLYIHALVSMGLHDAFISCWEEKYDSDRIRPESVIQKYVDEGWRPLLQTPPFPEYTSGHSVISTATAKILTAFFGDDFDFIDTSEVYFGLPEREFSSFLQASEEAAISRLYGGIHFRDAIEEGVKQGEKISDLILERINAQVSLAD